jgi:hypothetical protein
MAEEADAPECHGNARATRFVFLYRAGEDETEETIPIPNFDSGKHTFLAYQMERGPAGGRLHIQGCVGLKRSSRPGAAAASLDMPFARGRRTTFRIMHGTVAQAVSYCTSESYCANCHKGAGFRVPLPGKIQECQCGGAQPKGVVPGVDAYFRGTVTSPLTHQEMVGAAQGGTSMKDLLCSQADYVARNIRFVSTVLSTVSPVRTTAPVVIYLHGASGTGKTRFAASVCSQAQTFWTWSTQWFDGITSATMHTVLDDVRPDKTTPPAFWLRLLDRYPFRVPIKGSSVEFSCPVITITSPCDPSEWWSSLCAAHQTREDELQFTRRLTRVVQIPADEDELEEVRHQMRMAMRLYATAQREIDESYDPTVSEVPPTKRQAFIDRMTDH